MDTAIASVQSPVSHFLLGFMQGLSAPAMIFTQPITALQIEPLQSIQPIRFLEDMTGMPPVCGLGLIGASFNSTYEALAREKTLG